MGIVSSGTLRDADRPYLLEPCRQYLLISPDHLT
jgi:hypothetical protein